MTNEQFIELVLRVKNSKISKLTGEVDRITPTHKGLE